MIYCRRQGHSPVPASSTALSQEQCTELEQSRGFIPNYELFFTDGRDILTSTPQLEGCRNAYRYAYLTIQSMQILIEGTMNGTI